MPCFTYFTHSLTLINHHLTFPTSPSSQRQQHQHQQERCKSALRSPTARTSRAKSVSLSWPLSTTESLIALAFVPRSAPARRATATMSGATDSAAGGGGGGGGFDLLRRATQAMMSRYVYCHSVCYPSSWPSYQPLERYYFVLALGNTERCSSKLSVSHFIYPRLRHASQNACTSLATTMPPKFPRLFPRASMIYLSICLPPLPSSVPPSKQRTRHLCVAGRRASSKLAGWLAGWPLLHGLRWEIDPLLSPKTVASKKDAMTWELGGSC